MKAAINENKQERGIGMTEDKSKLGTIMDKFKRPKVDDKKPDNKPDYKRTNLPVFHWTNKQINEDPAKQKLFGEPMLLLMNHGS